MKNDHVINVLQVTIGDGLFAGVANFLYTYYSHMDHSKVHFDFLYCGENSMASKQDDPVLKDSEITALHILKSNSNGFSEYKVLLPELKKLFSEKTYDIVHVNSSNPYVNFCVACAMKGKGVYIAHSHNVKSTITYTSKAKQLLKDGISAAVRGYIIKKARMMFACSNEAGMYLFGENGIKLRKFRVINNAIDTAVYRYNEEKRARVRDGKDALIVGMVGRLSDQKNPEFAVRVFAELKKKEPKAVLWMVGDGDLRSKVEETVSELGLNDSVVLWGQRNDVADLVQGMDVLIFPSLFEGFGIVAIEAQCSGLPVVASDQVPQAANVAGLVSYLSLNEPVEKWADKILDVTTGYNRKDMSEVIKEQNYDIYSEAKKLQRCYQRLAEKCPGTRL